MREDDRQAVPSAEQVTGFLLVLPILIIFLLTRVGPTLYAFFLSFTQYSIVQSPKWIGLTNYAILVADPVFMRAVVNTLVYAVATTGLSTVIGLALALALERPLRGRAILRTAYFIPVVVSAIAVGSIWDYVLNAQFGILNYLLSLLGIPKQSWLIDPRLALPSLIVVGVWQNLGYAIMVFLAGLSGIPDHLKEAATVDGASGWRLFRRITWPLLRPTTTLVVLLTGVTTVQVFDQIVVLTNGGPANSTTSVVHQLYLNGFLYLKMGYASAMSLVLFGVMLVLSALTLRVGRQTFTY